MSSSILDAHANGRLLSAVRIATGATGVARGVVLLFLGADILLVLPWLLLSTAVLFGWRARVAATALLVFGVLIMMDGYYKNHMYLMWLMLLLVAVSDCERHYAVRRRGSGPIPGWPLMLMRFQLSTVYVFAGLAKINGAFLDGDVLAHYFDRAILPLPDMSAVLVPLALVTVALELFNGIAVWLARLRPAVFAIALPLHAGMISVAYSGEDAAGVAIFAVLMFTLLATFLEVPERGRALVGDAACAGCSRWLAALRRADSFGAFRVEPDAKSRPLTLIERDGSGHVSSEAARRSLSVLPGGFLLAPWLALPGLRHASHALHRRACACAQDAGRSGVETSTPRIARDEGSGGAPKGN